MAEEQLSLEGVQQLLESKREEASWMGYVDTAEVRGKKEKTILVVAKNRIFFLKPGGKLVREAHLLEITEIQSSSSTDINLGFKTFKINITYESADDIINKIRETYASSFPGVPETDRYKLDVPPSRLVELPTVDHPLGGFITTYKAICEFYSVPPREDIIWDMENLFVPGHIKDFNLKEFEQPLVANDVKALVGVLQYNTYFKSFTVKNIALDKVMIAAVAEMLKFNKSIEELILNKASINKEGIAAISDGLAYNKLLALTTVNLSGNLLEDKGMQSFANYIGGMNRGLVRLELASCGIGKAGIQALGNALKRNVHMSSTLTYFDVSNNKLDAEGSAAIAAFLANPNAIRYLFLGNTNAQLDSLMGAILRGCPEMATLDISKNKLTKKEVMTLCKFLQGSGSLSSLNLSDTTFPVDGLKDLITSMSQNVYLKSFTLNLSDNKLGVPGARVLCSVADKLTNIASLDLSENEFGDEGVAIITEGLCYNSALKHLSLDKNFKSKTKAREHAIECLINLVNSECPLESLSIAGGPKTELKQDIIPLLYALATNETLQSLDVSGNQMGNKGASALGKALQTNTSLHTLKWDNNLTTAIGFYSFNIGLKRNTTLKNMPLPLNDISSCLKGSEAEETIEIVRKIERSLARNQSPTPQFQGSDGTDVGRTNQFAFLSSGQREEVQKLLFKIKSTGRKVTDNMSKIVIEDAEAQDNIMTSLYNIDDAVHQAYEHELRKQMITVVKTLAPLYGKMKAQMIEQLVSTVKQSYKCFNEETVRRLQTNLAFGGKDLTEEDYEKILIEGAAAQLSTKGKQAFRSTVNICSDYLYEKIQDQLQDIADELTSEVNRNDEPIRKSSSAVSPPPKSPRDAPKATSPAKAAAPEKPKTPVKKPEPAPKKAAAPARPDRPPKKPASGGEAHVEALPKAEGNLEHLTKARPTQQKKKPPTRKPRPAPPTQTQM